jgi:O-succinylbenzoic acid--CoA ligase
MELARQVDRTRDALRRRLDGVAAPVVAVVGGAGPETVATLLALLEDRVSFVLIHPRWTRAERDRAIAMAGACVCVESGGALATGPAPAAVSSPSVGRGAAIVFTSGTTGRPRGAVLSRAALRASALAHGRVLGWGADDRWLLSLPTAHVGGLMIVVRCLHARRTVVVGGRRASGSFDAGETLRVVERDRVTLLSVVPTMLARLLQATGRPPPSLRAVLVGGAGAAPALMERARESGWPVFATYGLTEACSQVATERPGETPGGVGTPLPGVEVRVAARDGTAGTIEVRGDVLFDGYLGLEPCAPLERPFEADGWFDTGDLGAIGEDGLLRVVGRRSDRIVTGGENVDPAEVEAAVLEWAGAAAACVVGLEDEEWGERVGAVLVPAAAFEALGGLAGLGRHLGGHLAGFKRPRCWSVVDGLPLAASGKVDRSACVRLLVDSPSPPPGQAGL